MRNPEDEAQKLIAERIKKLREELKLTRAEMARMCDYTQTAYTKIEKAETGSITIEKGKLISKALNVSFTDLFDLEEIDDSNRVLANENEILRKRIIELEEQLNDKRQIIEFLSNNDFLKEVAWIIKQREYKFEKLRKPFDFSDDHLINYDLDREKFMKDEAEEYLKRLVKEGKTPPKGINKVP